MAEVLEHEVRGRLDAEFLRQFPRGCFLIRLGGFDDASQHPVQLPGEARCVLRAAVYEHAPFGVAAHDRRYAVQPPLADRFAAVHHPHGTILLVHPIHQLTHESHSGQRPRPRSLVLLARPGGVHAGQLLGSWHARRARPPGPRWCGIAGRHPLILRVRFS